MVFGFKIAHNGLVYVFIATKLAKNFRTCPEILFLAEFSERKAIKYIPCWWQLKLIQELLHL